MPLVVNQATERDAEFASLKAEGTLPAKEGTIFAITEEDTGLAPLEQKRKINESLPIHQRESLLNSG